MVIIQDLHNVFILDNQSSSLWSCKYSSVNRVCTQHQKKFQSKRVAWLYLDVTRHCPALVSTPHEKVFIKNQTLWNRERLDTQQKDKTFQQANESMMALKRHPNSLSVLIRKARSFAETKINNRTTLTKSSFHCTVAFQPPSSWIQP